MKTKLLKRQEKSHKWHVVDVGGRVLGRAASEIAVLLMGKDEPDFTSHVDGGAGVIALNCEKIKLTGNKKKQKYYKRYSGYPSGQKEITYEKMLEKDPTFCLQHAVKGMLPKNKLGKRMIRRLKAYAGGEHPHKAQQPLEHKSRHEGKK